MPKPDEESVKDPGDIEVPLNPPEKVSADEQWRRDQEERITKLHNDTQGNRRILEKIQKTLESRPTNPEPAPPARQPSSSDIPEKGTDDYYQWLVDNGKWQQAVDERAEARYQQLRDRERQEETNRATQTQRQAILAKSRAEVIAEYPELDPENGDPNSTINQLYGEVLNQDPSLLSDPYGPTVALHRAERLAASRGIDLKGPSASLKPDEETHQGIRRTPTTLPPSRGANKRGNSYTLSKEQRDYCDQNGLKYEDYARTARAMEENGGITV